MFERTQRGNRWMVAVAAIAVAFGLGVAAGVFAFGGATRTTVRSGGGLTVVVPARTSGPGPARTQRGVPVGFARTREGAVAAATQYVTLLSGDVILNKQRVRSVLSVIVAPSALGALEQAYEQGVDLARRRLGLGGTSKPTVVLRSGALGYHVDHYGNGMAAVSVWSVGLAGSSATVAPAQSWSTTLVTLSWTHGDWKLESLETTPGPTPSLAGSPSSAPQLFDSIPRLEDYAHAQRP